MPRDEHKREENRQRYGADSYERQKEREQARDARADDWIARREAEIAAKRARKKKRHIS